MRAPLPDHGGPSPGSNFPSVHKRLRKFAPGAIGAMHFCAVDRMLLLTSAKDTSVG